MVHHTMPTKMSSAPRASNSNKVMQTILGSGLVGAALLASLLLAGCAGPSHQPLPAPADQPAPSMGEAPDTNGQADVEAALRWAAAQPLPPPIQRPRAQWKPVPWSDLPGLPADVTAADWHGAWDAWIRSCSRTSTPSAAQWAEVCRQVRPLSLASPASQLAWMVRNLQPYRVTAADGNMPQGLLTGYYEPELPASRARTPRHTTPLYAPPAGLNNRQPWFSRQDIDSRADVQALLTGRELVWLDNPIDALIVQIQGSARVRVTEPDGSEKVVRLGFAGHNGHTYRSVGRWLLDRKAITDASWAAIKVWAAQNPDQVSAMLWSNPRTVFFREEALSAQDAQAGPRGAQGVPLTPQRSVAVDPEAVPYGTPLWLNSTGPSRLIQRLVLAQDTGAAITGPARADYFSGWGDNALAIAQGLRQPLQMWTLWPR